MTTPGTGAPLVELARSWLEIVGPLGVFLHADDCRAPELRHSGRLTVSVAPCPTGQSWGGLWGIRGCARSAPRRPSQPCGGVRLRSLRGPGNRFLIGRRSSAEAGSGPRTEQNRPPFQYRSRPLRRRREANASRLPPAMGPACRNFCLTRMPVARYQDPTLSRRRRRDRSPLLARTSEHHSLSFLVA